MTQLAETVVRQPEEPLSREPEDPLILAGLPVGDPLRALHVMPEHCADCPALKQCVDMRVARNVADSRADVESRVFPVLQQQAIPGKGKTLKTFVRKALHTDAIEFVREHVSEVRCMTEDQRTLLKRVVENVAQERTKPVPPHAPELSLEEMLKVARPENVWQKSVRWLSFKFSGDTRLFAKHRHS